MDYEKCYVYEPETPRPTKRRKVELQGLHASWPVRRRAFDIAWQGRQRQIDVRHSGTRLWKALTLSKSQIDKLALQHVVELDAFLQKPVDADEHDRIPTAILVCGPESSSYNKIIGHLARSLSSKKNTVLIPISSNTGANLKSLLKSVIQSATSQQTGLDDEDDDEPTQRRKGGKLPNYDLQLLADFVGECKLEQVVIAIESTEAFDSEILSEFVEIMGQWQDRIPFVLLLSVATGVHPLQQRLSRAAARCLQGQAIDVSCPQAESERVLESSLQNYPPIWLGGEFIGPVLDRQQDYIEPIDSLVQSIKYAYMSHYYANPLVLFLVPDIKLSDIPSDHFEAVRNVTSFRAHCKELLEQGEIQRLQSLLDSDKELFDLALEKTREIQAHLTAMLPTLQLLQRILYMTHKSHAPAEAAFSKLYTAALAGRLTLDSTLIRSTLLTLRKSPSITIINVSALLAEKLPAFAVIHQELITLRNSAVEENQDLRSEEEIRNSTLRTTVVARKVELSKQRANLSKRDETYTALIKRMNDMLERHLEKSLADPRSVVFHELVIYDLKSPHREAFTPRPRHAIERALAAPHDYLDCECCAPNVAENGASEEVTLSASQPATAVLYQLYLESGSLINVHDLWQAFRAVMMPSSEIESTEGELLALFQRSLTELQYLGFVKATRKRADHVAKVSWRGL